MKLLIYQWSAYLESDILDICQEKGIQCDCFSWNFSDRNTDETFISSFRNAIEPTYYDACLSMNYWPLLSQVCQEVNLKYIAWCYDNPLDVLKIEETLNNPVNYVFLFDKIQYNDYKQRGFHTVYHLPLGVNKTRMNRLSLSEDDYKRYSAQVSLVGKLYESQLSAIMTPMNELTKSYLNTCMDRQSLIYGRYILNDCITNELIEDINHQYLEKSPNTKMRLSKEALSFAMACEVTRMDRIILLTLCGKRFDTRLYSYQDCDIIQNIKKYPAVDYLSEMPKVFACSKINLNPTLRIIQTGIPLRAFDIMGAGGFLLSNYQEELLELFQNEKEMVSYTSLEDAIEKIDFYLRHESMRETIARNGQKKTLEAHSLQLRMKKIFSVTGL